MPIASLLPSITSKTDFVRKGRAGKHEHQRKQLVAMITKERANKLKVVFFGKDKQHYYLNRIKARTKANEILWIFFVIHVNNALEIGRRMQESSVSGTNYLGSYQNHVSSQRLVCALTTKK